MANKSIPLPTQSEIPEREPLGQFAPSIYDVARFAMDDIDSLRTLHQAIIVAADFNHECERHDLVHKLMLIQGLAQIGKAIGDDKHNDRDCQIAACMLDSEDPAVRAEARP